MKRVIIVFNKNIWLTIYRKSTNSFTIFYYKLRKYYKCSNKNYLSQSSDLIYLYLSIDNNT